MLLPAVFMFKTYFTYLNKLFVPVNFKIHQAFFVGSTNTLTCFFSFIVFISMLLVINEINFSKNNPLQKRAAGFQSFYQLLLHQFLFSESDGLTVMCYTILS